MAIIYRVYNIHTQESYIGQTYNSLQSRWSKHKAKAYRRKANTKLAKALRDLGLSNFDIETIEEINSYDFNTPQELQDHIDKRELFYISKYDSIQKGYNTNDFCQGYRNPSRTKDSKISIEELKRQFLEENQTREEIRKRLKISKNHFHRLVKSWNLEKSPKIIGETSAITKMLANHSPEQIKLFKELYNNNSTVDQIIHELGISRSSFYRLKKFLKLGTRGKDVTIIK